MEFPYRLGKYELDKQIGSGATGRVYHAIDSFSGGEVAVKMIDVSVLHDPEFNEVRRSQFRNEAALAGRLVHPHVVAILEAAMTEDAGYIVMEYVPGGSLAPYTFHDKLLPIADVLQIIYKCCNALEYAYSQGIVHRDIKPGNIMRVSGSNVKIADFGTAVFYKEQVTDAVTAGTPSYMSPEHLGGHAVSFLSDMYSLGIVAYQMLTGQLPFEGENSAALFEAITSREPPPPSARRFGLPGELDAIVLKMIAKRPEDRYPSWEALSAELAGLGWFGASAREISDSEKYRMLRGMKNLEDFPDPELWELVHASKWYRLPDKSVVVREGELGSSLYVLASGSMRVVKRDYLLNIIQAGEFFGEMAYIDRGSRRNATLESLNDVVIAEFPFAGLEKLSSSCELRLSRRLLKTITDRLKLADERIVSMHG